MTPLLSIVTGTYNRKPYLEKFIGSVRDTVPASLPMEFVVCDGGSTDGTLDWLRAQPDVRLIEHGELRGAIKAFGDAARVATGDYVLLANDDVVVHPGGIVQALAHLEANPTCGAVAFQDNRQAPGYGDDYKVQYIGARTAAGLQTGVIYPQVGMVRRWMGEAAGWWGDQHPVMGTGATYGGDTFLGARIWELGYAVDEVEGCRVDDLVPPDKLREHNKIVEQQNPGVYYKVYPNGPVIASEPQLPNPQQERLRILYAPLYEPSYGKYKRGLLEALQRVGLVLEWDYLNEPGDLATLVEAWQPHLCLLQLHGVDRITEFELADARAAKPDMIVVNWNGDTYREHLVSTEMLSLLRHVDLQLVVNAGVIDEYARHGIRAAYWQVAFEPVDYEHLPAVAAHDVVFLGNAYTPERKALGEALRAMDGVNVGLYGAGWRFASGNTTYNFEAGAALYANSKIAIGDNQYPDDRGFVSNRLFEALASGAFLLHQAVPGLEELTGLQDGVHYVSWDSVTDLQTVIRHWLKPKQDAKRRAIAAAGRDFVRERHSFDARVTELFDVLLPMIEGEPEYVAT